ncbi:MAG TPA: OmpA family protein [Polyangiaceae bacterium]|nr:OmpA family protein [Polyangiaceae bacterium]
MSPAILRGVMGSCLALGVADLAWLDVNAERMAGSAPTVPTVPIEPTARATRIERHPPLAPPISDEELPPVMKTESRPSPPEPEGCVVHFDRGVSTLSYDQAEMLTPIADALKTNPKAVVRVEGHADRTGWKENTGSNLVLSDARAAAIVATLGKLGIPRDRIRSAAFGDTRPVDDGTTEEAFRRNRRAEVRIELPGDR